MKRIMILLSLWIMCGCSVSNNVWKYTAEPKIYQEPKVKASIQIPAFRDLRKNDNEILNGGKFFLAMLPLVPYATVTDIKVPEGNIAKAPEIFAQATGEEIANAALFDDVIIMPTSQKMNSDYLLEGTILSSNVRQTITYYGLSLPGDLLWLLGAPMGKAYNDLTIQYRLLDKKYDVIWDKTYFKEKGWLLSFYNQEGLNYYEELYKDINMQLLEDLKEIMKRKNR